MTVEEAIAHVWPGEAASGHVLGGGITNHNYRVTVSSGETFVLRIAGSDTESLGIDRAVEYEASLAAAAVGVGPEVVGFYPEHGLLVTRFIPGEPVPLERMTDRGVVRQIAQSLRAVHSAPPLPARFNSFRVVEDYREIAYSRGVEVPRPYVAARQLARKIERARGAVAERPCHNDLLNANFIDDGARIRIVDWEYAGMGDVFFDLANFSINQDLDQQGQLWLLEEYFGAQRERDLAALQLMRFMSDFREAMWGVVQSAISELDFDFSGYAAEHFDRLEATAASDAFQVALREGW